MKFKVMRPVEADVEFLYVYPGGRVYPEDIQIGNNDYEDWDEIKSDFPELFDKSCDFYLRIKIDTGQITNWPVGIRGGFESVKVVDEGRYELYDTLGNLLNDYDGYVPDCLAINEEGYGDYFEFTVNDGGYIKDWKFDQNDFNELMGVDEED